MTDPPKVRALLVALILGVGCAPAVRVASSKGGGFVTASDGVRIHYLDSGGRGSPALLFVPGWMTPGWIWEAQLAHFSRAHRVVAMDPRAQGESEATTEGLHPAGRAGDIRAVVTELELRPVVLIGATMAVAEIVAYVDRYGTDGVAAIVLVNGIAGRDYDAATLQGLLGYAAKFQIDRRAATERFVKGLFKTPRDEAYLERMVASSLRTPTSAAMAMLVGSIAADYRATLPRIDRPTLIVVARMDAWMPLYQDLTARIPGARLEVWDGAGHALFVDDPKRFNALLEELLGSLPGRPPAP